MSSVNIMGDPERDSSRTVGSDRGGPCRSRSDEGLQTLADCRNWTNFFSKFNSCIFNRICAVVMALALLPGCENKIKDMPSNTRRQLVPEEGVQVESYLSEAAKVKGKLTSPYMLRYQKSDTPYSEFPRTLHVDFYTDSLKIESQMDARYGKYLPNQNKVFLRDSVVVKNILKGDTLHCKYLWWDQQTQKFTTDDSVQIYTPDKILFGTGMEADQNFRWYTIKHLTGSVLTSQNAMPGSK